MSTVPLVDFQHELGDVLIGRGTPVTIRSIEGLGQSPVRTFDAEPPGEDGTWLGADLYEGRRVRIDAAVKTPTTGAAGALDALAALQALADTPAVRGTPGATLDLRLKFPGRDVRIVRGRLRKLDADLTQAIHGYIPVDIEVQAADHRYYADTLDTTSIPLGLLSHGGFTAPIVPPFTVAGDPRAVGRPSLLTVEGTASTSPLLRVTGPCADPTITHLGGTTLTVLVTLAAGEWVEVDTRPGWRTVTTHTGGAAPLTPASRVDQFALTPGLNEIAWTATDPTLTSTLAVTWWPAHKAL